MRLYIGIDFGWKCFRYEVRTENDVRTKRGSGVSTPDGLRAVLEQYKMQPSIQVAYEAGTQLYWINQVVKEMGMDSYPFHAAHLLLTVKSKNKTDKKDAEKIARAAAKQNLPPRIVIPEEDERELRELMSEREARKKQLTSCGNQLHALAIGKGFQLDKKRLAESEENWEKAVSRFQGQAHKHALRLYKVALGLFQVLEEIEESIRELVTEKMGEALKRLKSLPGIGFWTGTALLAWCGPEASRFATGRHAASYFGLVGTTYQSGELNRLGHITKAGPPLVRRLMIQAAWSFLGSREGKRSKWGAWFWRITRGGKSKKKIAVVAVARKLLTAAVACLRNQTCWDRKKLEEDFDTMRKKREPHPGSIQPALGASQ